MMRQALTLLLISLVAGCARSAPPTENSTKVATTQPILYHRTGGIAGTNDRLVIWPDGVVQVEGKLFSDAAVRLPGERHAKLAAMFDGWEALKGEYLSNNIIDAYTITIHYGDNAVVANDIAPDMPQQFRDIFTALEAVAFEAQQQQPPHDVQPSPAAP